MRRDVSAIAKIELKRSAVGPIFWAGKMLFIDRSDSRGSVEIFAEAKSYVKQGISFAVAPEGTRSDVYELGAFKKGAFRLAMNTGVPLTPIVFKNSHDTLPKGKYLVQASEVIIDILPPIFTDDWTLDNLENKIEGVRNLFLKTLEQQHRKG